MLNLISGEHRPDHGEIRLSGENIAGLRPFQITRRGVARTFQLVRVLPGMSALENVMVGGMFANTRIPRGKARFEAAQRLEQVGLAGKGDVPAGRLTYIDQKRLELGRALATRPSLLLLDKWLAGLNPTELALGIDLVQTIGQSGVTMILVEQVMLAVRTLSDRVIVMDAGSKVAEGKPEAAWQIPRSCAPIWVTMMLEVKDLCVAYGGHVALADVTLRLERETVVILGANGAGKSRLLKTIAGVMRRSAGAHPA